MRIGAIVLVRYSSSRLPGKALRSIAGKPLLQHIVDTLNLIKGLDDVAVATSNDSTDDIIFDYCQARGIHCFRGSLDCVAERFYESAKGLHLTHAFRINGDNLFVNIESIEKILQQVDKSFDLISNVPGRTYPPGMSVELINVESYSNVLPNIKGTPHEEHVTSSLYDSSEFNVLVVKNSTPILSNIHLAVDTKYDFVQAEKIIESVNKPVSELSVLEVIDGYYKVKNKMNFVGKYGPLLIAEIGGNHEGDFEYAKRLTQLAIESDADFIKFQVYSGDLLVNSKLSPDRNAHFKKFELSKEQYRELARIVTDAGKKFMASIWHEEQIDWLDEFMPIYKVGSGDLMAWNLLEVIAKKGKPIILSTGLAQEEEVLATVDFIRSRNDVYKGPDYLSVLQCTSMYPIPYSSANLSVMPRLSELTNSTPGYSDHTEGALALEYAVAMGARVLEFHFTDERKGKQFRDHKVSLTKKEVLGLIDKIKIIDRLKGDEKKQPVEIEIRNGHLESFRKGLFLNRDMKVGDTISRKDLTTLRPCIGIGSENYFQLIGKKLVVDVCALDPLKEEYFESL